MIKREDVTIIIPHLGGSKEAEYALPTCWLSLQETEPYIPKIIALNGQGICKGHSLDGETNIIAVAGQGQCKAVNAAAATVTTPWIFVSNDDMVYAPGWFESLIQGEGITRNTMFDDPNRMCLSPMLIEPRPGAPTFRTFSVGGAGGDFNKEAWLLYAKDIMGVGILRTGFNLPFLIKKELWDLIGGYDVNYDPWSSNSDSDLEYKIRLAGIQPYQNTKSLVYHFSQTSGTFEPRNQGAWQKNWDYFIEKWGFPRTDSGIWQADFHMPTKEEGRKFQPEWEGKYGKVY